MYRRVVAKKNKPSTDMTVFVPSRLAILESDRAVLHDVSTLDTTYSQL